MPGWYEFGWFVLGVATGSVVTQGIRWVDWIKTSKAIRTVTVHRGEAPDKTKLH